ncbi:MAG: hypothetical protein GF346_08390 [Candidatus Eisenbacteria bacterium]|nr:hypothetical protein [Candidatus Latescibacterota bacterium]MBD3302452.1 hypothetical protein [Candidatus Eisenbacteria bacterium]
MPLETYTGHMVPPLLSRAREEIGRDAVILSVKRVATSEGLRYAVVAADPDSAERVDPATASRIPEGIAAVDRLRGLASTTTRAERPVIALVGPTGSGKSTTIAKLAAHPLCFCGRRAGILCLDTYRIGAVEQARLHARLGGMEVEVIRDREEVPEAMERMAKREVLFVDTPGRGPLAWSDRRAVERILSWIRPTEVHLVVPSGLRLSVAHRIVENHRSFGITHLLPSKLDEAPDGAWIERLAAREGLPVRWIANGQRIPDDLMLARDGARAAEVAA